MVILNPHKPTTRVNPHPDQLHTLATPPCRGAWGSTWPLGPPRNFSSDIYWQKGLSPLHSAGEGLSGPLRPTERILEMLKWHRGTFY